MRFLRFLRRCVKSGRDRLQRQPRICSRIYSAVRFFREKIWPSLRSRPGLTWKIIGKNPEAIRGIIGGDPRIEVTGSIVDDAINDAGLRCRLRWFLC